MTPGSGSGVRCVVFDFDGTLVDSNPIKRGTYFEVLAGIAGSAPVIESVLARHPRADRYGVLAAVHEALAEGGVEGLPPVARLVDAYSETCEARVVACAEIPGASAALEALAPAHALYLASATPEDALARVVAGRGWTDRFAGVYGGPRTKVENLERIAAREGVAREQLVYVGDGALDREAAELFGCGFFGVGTRRGALPDGPLAPLAPLVEEIARRAG